MGNLLRLLSRDESCCSLPKYDVFVDFESAAPTPDEVQVSRKILFSFQFFYKTVVFYSWIFYKQESVFFLHVGKTFCQGRIKVLQGLVNRLLTSFL